MSRRWLLRVWLQISSSDWVRSMLTVSPWVSSGPNPTGGTSSRSGWRRTKSDTMPCEPEVLDPRFERPRTKSGSLVPQMSGPG